MRKLKSSFLCRLVAFLALGMFIMPMSPGLVYAKAKASTKIKHKPIKYFVAGKRISIEASVKDEQGVNLVRCYFRNKGEADYVFVKMQAAEKGDYNGILPAPSDTAETIEYLFLVVNGANEVVKTQTYEVGKEDKDKAPNWQKASSEGDITVSTELAEAPKEVPGFSDSITMDVVESSARFGIVAGGLYSASSLAAGSGAAGTTGTAASATTAGTVTATAGITTTVAIGAAAAALAGGAAVASSSGSSDSDEGDHHGDEVTTESLDGNWYVTESDRPDWYMDATLYEGGTFELTEYLNGEPLNSSGTWSYSSSSRQFNMNVTNGGDMGGIISGSADDFYVDGNWANGDPGYFHWVRR